MEEQKSGDGKTFILGALIGAAVAWFLTPKTGKENREVAKEKIDDLKKKIEGKTVKEVVEDIFGKKGE